MQNDQHKQALRELRLIPGVGPSIANDLWQLGIRSIGDLRGRSPQALYEQLCAQTGTQVDRSICVSLRSLLRLERDA
jgi:nucleotidyltransferase/DNA polymerase involved in DNA repair